MLSEEALAIVDEAIGKIPELRNRMPFCPDHIEFVQTTGIELSRIFGPDSVVVRNFSSINYQFQGTFLANFGDMERKKALHQRQAYLRGLDIAEGILSSAREQLTRHGVEKLLNESRIKVEGAKVFISNGTPSKALEKVERFIRALGLQPLIVMRQPSEGLAIDDLVDKRMEESDCCVILATGDEEVAGRRQPRANVLHEIGLAQEKMESRIIYLKEVGCDFPSNVRPKVWENFQQENMEAAFEKISKELHSFGLL